MTFVFFDELLIILLIQILLPIAGFHFILPPFDRVLGELPAFPDFFHELGGSSLSLITLERAIYAFVFFDLYL